MYEGDQKGKRIIDILEQYNLTIVIHRNKDTVVLKPFKGSGVVLLNKTGCIKGLVM